MPFRRNELCAGSQIEASLLANRILRAVTVGIVARVVEQSVHSLVAFEIDDPYDLALLDFENKRISGLNDERLLRLLGRESTDLQIESCHVLGPRRMTTKNRTR